jgi:putative spermidine/putrescine transport system permease protein
MNTVAAPRRTVAGRIARFFDRHPRLRLGTFLSAPLAWLVVAYLGSLVLMFLTSFNGIDQFTTKIDRSKWSLENFRLILNPHEPYVGKIVRTIEIAAIVTVIDIVLAVPIALYIGKLAPTWLRRAGVVAVLMPLWASYVVKAYAWRTLLNPQGGVLAKTFHHSPGFSQTGLIILLAYLWLPYMILPVLAGLERLPDSLLEASSDLGGRDLRTLRSIVLPLLVPAIAAGSIFTFSLSLGDYIAVGLVGGKTDVLGSVVSRQVATNLPFATAMAAFSIVIMACYLLGVRKLGAFESL